MAALFVDTSALYALADESDHHHERVAAVYEPHALAGGLLTTDYVIVESWLLVKGRLGPVAARNFWRGVHEGPLAISGVTEEDLERARALDEAFGDQDFGLVNASSFAVIERFGIEQALSLDVHYRIVRLGRHRRALTVLP